MCENLAPFIIVEVKAAPREWSYWRCAAALEPALATWLGPAWGELLRTHADDGAETLPVALTRDLYMQLVEDDCPSAVPIIVRHYLTAQAIEVMRQHGLAPVRVERPAEPDDEIPF